MGSSERPAPKAQVEVDESWIDAIEQKEAKEREAWLLLEAT